VTVTWWLEWVTMRRGVSYECSENVIWVSVGVRKISDRVLGMGDHWGCSIVTRGRRRIGGGKWHMSTRFFRCTIMHCLFLWNLYNEGGERTENRVPMPLIEVIHNVIQITCGHQSTELSIELLGGFDEIAGCVRFVCTLDLPHIN